MLCSISGINYTGFTLLSTQSTSATATIDYNQVALYVWNYTSRELTWYNQSVAENLQTCLKNGECTDWWINTTFTNIENTINNINSTANNIKTDTQLLLNYFNCSSTNVVCTRLNNILTNSTDILSRVYSLNTSQIPNLQSSIDSIYNNTLWLVNNTATQSNITAVLNGINDIQLNITFIKNNMFYQGNATSAFLVDYLATPYAEPGTRAELWILTRDLLGNAKTVSGANCNISQRGNLISNATVSINTGSVYAYWNVSNNTLTGEYYWDCALTGSTLNLKVPFFVSSNSFFSITSLAVASPKYPNEIVKVEATFATKNGSVTPNTIDMTILKYDYSTVWHSANKNKMHPFELAVLIHAKLTWIHPFEDGNGRTARAVMNFILMKKGFPMFFIPFEKREEYYKSLDIADKGDYKEYISRILQLIIEQIRSYGHNKKE